MARKTITLNTEPHVVEIGEVELQLQPEVMGDEFVEALGELREAQKAAAGIDIDDLSSLTPDKLRQAANGMRGFLARLMLPESADLFTRIDVVKDGKALGSFHRWEEADASAAKVKGGGAKAQWSLRLPDRAVIEIMEFAVDLYGGGSTERPPTSPSASAPGSSKPGRRGMGVSPSKASTRGNGR